MTRQAVAGDEASEPEPAATLAPWETTLGRRIYGEPITSRGSWLALHVVAKCPSCSLPVAVPLAAGVYCRCSSQLQVKLRARDAPPLIPLAPARST